MKEEVKDERGKGGGEEEKLREEREELRDKKKGRNI